LRDLRVLILPHRASGSGMASYTIHLANALAQSGMNVTLLGFQDKTFLDALSPLVNFKSLGIDKTFTDWLGGPYISYKIIRYLIQKQIAYLDINDFDVLHYVYPEAVVRKANSPTIISTSWGFSSIPEIIGDAHLKFSPRWQVPGMISELEFYLLDKHGYCKSDGVIATTTASMVYWQKQCNTRFNYIPVPLKLENRTPVINRNYTNDMISFFIGERDLARPRNNVYIAIRACKLLHKEGITDFNLHLIGRYDRRLQETVNKLKSEGIKIY
jgi:hypothetical protein